MGRAHKKQKTPLTFRQAGLEILWFVTLGSFLLLAGENIPRRDGPRHAAIARYNNNPRHRSRNLFVLTLGSHQRRLQCTSSPLGSSSTSNFGSEFEVWTFITDPPQIPPARLPPSRGRVSARSAPGRLRKCPGSALPDLPVGRRQSCL